MEDVDTNAGTRYWGEKGRGAAFHVDRAITGVLKKETMSCWRLAGVNPPRAPLHPRPGFSPTNNPFFVGVFTADGSFKELDDTDVGIDMC